MYESNSSFVKSEGLSANQEIPRIVWNPKIHCRINNSPPPVPLPSQINPVHVPHPTYWQFCNILPATPRISKWFFLSGLPTLNIVSTSHVPHTCHIPELSHSSWFDHSNNIWWAVYIIKLRVMQSSPLSSYLVLCRPKYLFSNTFSICFSVSAIDQVSHSCKTKRQHYSFVYVNL